jgi:hypothetical protein
MAFQKVEYTFPDEQEEEVNTDIEIEDSDAIEVDISGKPPEPEVEAKEEVEEDLDIEVVDDTPKADRNRKPSEPPTDVTDEELEQYSEKVRKRIQHFNKGYHDERRAKESAQREREELERYAQTLVDENKELRGNVNKNQEALLEQAKQAVTAEMEQARQAYKDAYESGDTERVMEAQEQLTNATLRTDKLDNFEFTPLQEDETPVKTDTEAVRDPKAQAWADANPWFRENEEMRDVAVVIHQSLVRDQISPQSDEYYEAINARMRRFYPDYFGENEEPEVEKPKRQSNVVAPATRSTAPKKVKLTQTQVALANRLGVPLEEYAKQAALEARRQNG